MYRDYNDMADPDNATPSHRERRYDRQRAPGSVNAGSDDGDDLTAERY